MLRLQTMISTFLAQVFSLPIYSLLVNRTPDERSMYHTARANTNRRMIAHPPQYQNPRCQGRRRCISRQAQLQLARPASIATPKYRRDSMPNATPPMALLTDPSTYIDQEMGNSVIGNIFYSCKKSFNRRRMRSILLRIEPVVIPNSAAIRAGSPGTKRWPSPYSAVINSSNSPRSILY